MHSVPNYAPIKASSFFVEKSCDTLHSFGVFLPAFPVCDFGADSKSNFMDADASA